MGDADRGKESHLLGLCFINVTHCWGQDKSGGREVINCSAQVRGAGLTFGEFRVREKGGSIKEMNGRHQHDL